MAGMPLECGERLWRVRKRYWWIDAQLHDLCDANGVEIRFLLEGAPVYVRRWRTRDLALADATDKLRELQRVGWSTHW